MWKPDASAPLWHLSKGQNHTSYFDDLKLKHLRQIGPSCVATTLCMVAKATGADVTPEYFKSRTNSQSPYSWSEALKPFGMQLAYCNHDQRRIEYIIDELKQLNDLFFVASTRLIHQVTLMKMANCVQHTSSRCMVQHSMILRNHADNGGVCDASDYSRLERQAKRIFRVVPVGHPRCL